MHLGSRNQKFSYTMSNLPLQIVIEDVGVHMTANLKSSCHCFQAKSKANQILGMINRTFKYKNLNVLLNLYKSLVRPILEYSAPAWEPHYIKDIACLEHVQHHFTRMIPGLAKISYPERLKNLNLWTLEESRNRADLLETSKIMNAFSLASSELLFRVGHSTTRGHTLKLYKNSVHTDCRKFFFSERVVTRS